MFSESSSQCQKKRKLGQRGSLCSCFTTVSGCFFLMFPVDKHPLQKSPTVSSEISFKLLNKNKNPTVTVIDHSLPLTTAHLTTGTAAPLPRALSVPRGRGVGGGQWMSRSHRHFSSMAPEPHSATRPPVRHCPPFHYCHRGT